METSEVYYGWLSLIPPLIVIVIALLTRLSLEPLIIGIVAGYIIIDIKSSTNFFTATIDSFTVTLQDDLMVWVIMVCCLYGALINLMIRSGGVLAFGNKMLRYADTKKKSLLTTWIFGTFLFVDDYLNALTTGTTMKKVTDHFNIPREMLAYVVSSTAVPICVIVPISTWVIFIGQLLEDNQLVGEGEGITAYLNIIPYISYGYIQFLLVPLTILGVIPIIGKMKTALKRAETTNQVIPDNSEEFKLDVQVFDDKKKSNILFLILPLLVLIGGTILMDLDALKGIIVALVFTIIYYSLFKVASVKTLSASTIEGMKSMLYALVLLVLSYVLKNLGDGMGLTQYVIDSVDGRVSKEFLPLIIFLTLGAIAFATGNSWGLYAIAIPLVIPLATALDCNMWLCIGAVVSAGAFGAHACFFSDATILASQGAECNNYEHGITQLPYALISFTLSCVIYVILGYTI
ncbi:MAG: Na+/H+ antiporter NhaC family protein [Chitinophagales bacterium]